VRGGRIDVANPLTEEKRLLRASMKEVLRGIPPAAATAMSEAIRRRVLESPPWRRAGILVAFMPMPGEVDIEPLLGAALAEGKALYVPRIEGESLSFRRVPSIHGPWEEASFGIREPPASAPLLAPDSGDDALVLVPGLAFDGKGGRLGRGKGYYDRFLASVPPRGRGAWFFLAPAFSAQIVGSVPVGDADARVDAIVTEREWIAAALSPPGVPLRRP
jgi:5-formyltetrahydrofolate cyclo-ligase